MLFYHLTISPDNMLHNLAANQHSVLYTRHKCLISLHFWNIQPSHNKTDTYTHTRKKYQEESIQSSLGEIFLINQT